VIVLVETWLHGGISDAEVLDDRYVVYRNDRNVNNSGKSIGGGVLIAVKKFLTSNRLSDSNSSLEDVWISLQCCDNSFVFGAIYLPPDATTVSYAKHVQVVKNLLYNNRRSTFFILGDYNLPNVKWINDSDTNFLIYTNANSDKDIIICDSLYSCDFCQFNTITNCNGNILDLCFSNYDYIKIENCNEFSKTDVFHPPFMFEISVDNVFVEDLCDIFYDYSNADYDEINILLSNVNWNTFDSCSDINEAVSLFYNYLHFVCGLFVPVKRKCKSSFPPWFDHEVRRLIRRKSTLHRRYKISHNANDYAAFATVRTQCKEALKKSYKDYIKRTENFITSDPKKFWKYINEHTKCNEIPNLMIYHNNPVCGNENIVNTFAEHFSSVYDDIVTTQPASACDNPVGLSVDFKNFDFTSDSVFYELTNLDCNKGAGPDGLPPFFYRNCCTSLTDPLWRIFKYSLNSGVFPNCWKSALVTPVFKSGSKQNFENYRPISILSVPAKIFEKLVAKHLSASFKTVISPSQHGFFANRSTVTNHFAFVNNVFEAFEGGFDVHCIYTDFCKAFDTVNHKILLNKLYTYGVRDPFLSWTSTYISNRTQHVVLKGVRSSAYCSTSGVPQGSIIGPLLFIIFINDITDSLTSASLLYADDLKIYKIIKTQLDVFDLQEDVRRIENWCARNGMKLNVCKCKAMCFSRKTVPSVPYYSLEGEQLEIINAIKDLGLFFDSNLSFHEHYDFLISRGRKMLGCLKRWTVDFKNTRAIIILYNSLVRSILEYNCVIWSPFYGTHISRIESVQNNFLKYLKYKLRTQNINFDDLHSVAAYMSLPSLKTRRDCHKLCFLHKIINYNVDSSDALLRIGFNVPLCNLRHPNLFHVYCHKQNYSYNSPLNSALRLANFYCNELDFCGVSTNKFKSDCRRLLCK
jgi:hypothetical protein